MPRNSFCRDVDVGTRNCLPIHRHRSNDTAIWGIRAHPMPPLRKSLSTASGQRDHQTMRLFVWTSHRASSLAKCAASNVPRSAHGQTTAFVNRARTLNRRQQLPHDDYQPPMTRRTTSVGCNPVHEKMNPSSYLLYAIIFFVVVQTTKKFFLREGNNDDWYERKTHSAK